MHTTKKYRPQIIIIIIAIVLNACNKPKSSLAEYGPVFEKIMRSENGAFRGFNLGDQLEVVRAREAGKPVETDEGYLYYEYALDNSNSFNVSYTFDENGLSEIQSDIFIHNANATDSVFNSFKMYFDEHYGAEQTDKGYNIWTVKSDKYKNVRIALSDQSADFTTDKAPGKLSLSIYPDKD